jgi:hypothetical protein
LPSGCAITPTGLTLPRRLTFARWQAIGHALAQRRTQLKWAFGDWWRSGHAYGERKAMTEAPDWTGPSFSTCMNIGSVAEAFAETSRRREVLSFQHHVEVTKLEPAEADPLLQWCIDTGAPGRPRTISDLRQEIARRDPRTMRVIVRMLPPPPAQPVSARGQHIVRRLLARQRAQAGQTTQPEQASPARPLALPAPQQPQREPDARWEKVIGALEYALRIARERGDRDRFRDALNAARELRDNYLS